MYFYVYQITNLINGKIYVGKHKSSLPPHENGYYGSGRQIQLAIKKYGIENFTKEVLYYCSSLEEMSDRESQIVTEEFVKRKDTYNMHKGGNGGWEHINLDPVKRKEVTKQSAKRNKELGLGGTHNWTEQSIEKMRLHSWSNKIKNGWNPNNWAKMSEEQQDRLRKIKSEQSLGNKNSQYGKIWISNILTKEVKRITINDTIPEGWVRGKKGHVPKKLWVNNGIKEHYIALEKQQEYVLKGFICGRLPQKKNSLKM